MAKSTFVLPAGLNLDVSGDRLDLSYDGDVELESTLGRPLGTVVAGGNLTVRTSEPVTGDLRAGGTLTVEGEVDAGHLHGAEVVLGKHAIKCRAISATQKITIGAANISAEVIIAPEVLIDPKAQGRVTVIESRNERGATKIKGGFGLADYEDMFGNSAEFLAQRGLRPLGEEGPLPDGEPTPRAPRTKTKQPESQVPAPAPIAVTPPAPAPAAEEEDTDDPLSLSFDDLEPLVDPGTAKPAPATSSQDDLHQRLSEALGRILACYEGTDVPPAIDELRDLVAQRDYDALRQNITEVWNGLLGFHQKRGIRPHHQVTHAFNVIHGLVQ